MGHETRVIHHGQDPAYDHETHNDLRPRRLKPTVSLAKNSLVYFISIIYIDHPVWRGHRDAAKRGPPCGHRMTRNAGARGPLLLPCAPTGWSSITAWCGRGATPSGSAVAPGLHAVARTRRLRVRSRATWCPCGMPSWRHPAHRPFLRTALPNVTTIAPRTAYYRISYARDTVSIMIPYICVIVGCHSHVGMDTTNSERIWKDMSREETETKQLNRNNFSVDTHRAGVLSCYLLTTIEGKNSL